MAILVFWQVQKVRMGPFVRQVLHDLTAVKYYMYEHVYCWLAPSVIQLLLLASWSVECSFRPWTVVFLESSLCLTDHLLVLFWKMLPDLLKHTVDYYDIGAGQEWNPPPEAVNQSTETDDNDHVDENTTENIQKKIFSSLMSYASSESGYDSVSSKHSATCHICDKDFTRWVNIKTICNHE